MEGDPVLVDAEVEVVVVLGAVGASKEVLGARTEVDAAAAAAAAMVPLRSHGFGGEPIAQIRRTLTLRVQRKPTLCVSVKVKVNYG